MKLEEIRNISVLGAGIMGHGIAQSFLMGGYPVSLYDVKGSILDTAKAHMKNNLELFRQFGLIGEQDIPLAFQRLSTHTDLKAAVEGSDFIVEAAPEDLPIKQALFQRVESFCRKDTIIATNTSSLTLREIGAQVKDKERLVITHWFNPPHIVPTVEVVKGEQTSDETMATAYGLLAKIKKVPVKIYRELPGFVVNRIQVAMVREVFDLYEQGIASAEDIDRAVKGSFGFRLASIGPLLTADLGGLELWLRVCENLLPHIQSSKESPKALQGLVSQGHYGIKTGKGFYDYALDFSKEELDAAIQKRDREFLNRLKQLYWTDGK
ncbi:MAG: 3-hydroxyacyl-CoA dehydrogenase family protein [Thermodesulfobacteriota bacterium]|nr:3-hydroxyacyl-CoA dehydrogenase family protein [Thermodesulfobacteriota bacterium]